MELTFDYDSSRISFLRPDTSHYLVRVGEEWQPRRLHRAPRILGSSEFRLATITRSIRYPVTALQVGKQGTVLVGYTVGPDGHTTDYAIEGSLSKACDQEVARVLQLLPDTWIPAVYQGHPAATRHFLKVNFRIMSEAEHQRMIQARSGPAAKAQANDRPRYVQEVEVVAIGRTL
ncbi:energy transducer TonB [Hymenobacter weizhouensis]|uniref:energy transducer TonB n=1 Tax=Hymenobacter sp. YIM 151500-1 TaxID=2987689 RepID=UPI002226931B|nr:energy transducer TonB [Hymenobacter sp. YIM 151500-1]UYZ63345.1 energy transducer TonB [Hymenobacter sp. YIM 151500-1]